MVPEIPNGDAAITVTQEKVSATWHRWTVNSQNNSSALRVGSKAIVVCYNEDKPHSDGSVAISLDSNDLEVLAPGQWGEPFAVIPPQGGTSRLAATLRDGTTAVGWFKITFL